MNFPCHLYRTPGPHRRPGVGTYDLSGCNDAADFERLSALGWHENLEAAIAVKDASAIIEQVVEANEAIDDVSPATRDELEQKARELGIGFNSRTSDAVLAQRIAERV